MTFLGDCTEEDPGLRLGIQGVEPAHTCQPIRTFVGQELFLARHFLAGCLGISLVRSSEKPVCHA